MRKVFVSEFVTLDGVADEPDWTGPYWNAAIEKFKADELAASDALLLGRVTYENFAGAWPLESDDAFGVPMNAYPKYVPTTTLETASWNNSTLLKGDVAAQIRALKAQDGKDIILYGSSTLAGFLLENDLVDQYNLMVFPVVKGNGIRLFKEGASATGLELVETIKFETGVVVLIYRPAKKEA